MYFEKSVILAPLTPYVPLFNVLQLYHAVIGIASFFYQLKRNLNWLATR
jgi:hypothetical protein